MKKTIGNRASLAGKMFETAITDAIHHQGYIKLDAGEKHALVKLNKFPSYEKWYSEQVKIGETVYKAPWNIDVVLYSRDKYPDLLMIECKWQSSGGSVDEKYPFTVLSLKAMKPPALLIVAGGGASERSLNWVRSQQVPGKFRVLNLDQFLLWAQREL